MPAPPDTNVRALAQCSMCAGDRNELDGNNGSRDRAVNRNRTAL